MPLWLPARPATRVSSTTMATVSVMKPTTTSWTLLLCVLFVLYQTVHNVHPYLIALNANLLLSCIILLVISLLWIAPHHIVLNAFQIIIVLFVNPPLLCLMEPVFVHLLITSSSTQQLLNAHCVHYPIVNYVQISIHVQSVVIHLSSSIVLGNVHAKNLQTISWIMEHVSYAL